MLTSYIILEQHRNQKIFTDILQLGADFILIFSNHFEALFFYQHLLFMHENVLHCDVLTSTHVMF